VFGRLNPDHFFVPAKSSPGQQIDLMAAQPDHRSKKEDFELLGGKLLSASSKAAKSNVLR
jgi:hypothetical protein